MTATLPGAGRSSARAAQASPAAAGGGEPSAVTEAVFRTIADGRARTLEEIASAVAQPALAVAGELERLRCCGMRIDGADRVTTAPFVPLDRAMLTDALGVGRTAWDAQVVFATRSTNSDLLAQVRADPPEQPVLRAAELQLAGRGRLGRRWASAPSTSLTASFALTVRRRLSALDGASLVCGLAVHEMFDALGIRARLKWPNDVLVDGSKLAGILVEAHPVGESSVLVIGIGINVAGAIASDEPSSDLRRTTLEAAGARGVDRNALAARLARSLEAHMASFEASGFGGFAGRWNAVDAFGDRCVTVEIDGRPRRGMARGVDERGALLVDIDGRRRRIVAGDVSLRPAPTPDEVAT